MKLSINPEYEKLVPPLPKIQFNALSDSIEEKGLGTSLIVNPQGVILDGHHRYKICKKLKIPVTTVVKEFENKILEKIFVGECNIHRRQSNPFVRCEIVLKLKEEYAKEAHQRKVQGGKEKVPQKSAEAGDSRDILAKKAMTSHDTLEKVEWLLDHATPEELEELRTDETKVNTVYNKHDNLIKVEKQESLSLPSDKYQLIYADPPWSYGNFHNSYNTGHTAAELYTVMESDELQKLPVPKLSTKDSVLLMWVTYPCLEEGLELIKEWGFIYKTVAFTWVKKNKSGEGYFFGLGNYTRANAEICLLATKGNGLTVKSHSVDQICDAPLTRHSEKPSEIRDRIVELFGDVKRIELFARTKSEGWKSWGNEL